MVRIESPVRCARLDTRGQNSDARGRIFFRPLDDLFVQGLGAAAGQSINGAIFRD